MTETVGLIGAGLLGTALGRRLKAAGCRLVVFDLNSRRARELGKAARSAKEVAGACQRILTCLPTSGDVRHVAVEMSLRRGQVLIDATTGDPADVESLGRYLARRGVDFVEIPIAASSAQVEKGEALALAGGRGRVVARHSDLLSALARRVLYAGPWGAAARLKLVHNLVLGLNRVALAEGVAFARSLGIPPARALDMLKDSAAASRVMEAKGPKMARGDFAPEARLAQHLKDVRLILAEARRAGLDLPISLRHCDILERAVERGFGDLDNSAIVKVYGN